MTDTTTQKPYLYLPGGNPYESFNAAYQKITRRSGRYGGVYNELYRHDNGHAQAIAAGLSADFGATIETSQLFFAHGAKNALHYSATFLAAMCDIICTYASKAGKPKPRFQLLHRTPGYLPVIEAFKGRGFDVVGLEGYVPHGICDDLGGAPGSFHHFEKSTKNVRDYSAGFVYTLGFFDTNPCNPTGAVRGENEIRKTAARLGFYRACNIFYLRDILGVKLHNLHGSNEMFRIIEDQIYRGLEYKGEERPFSFRQIDELRDITQTVLGVAKYGLVGLRSGLIVAPRMDAAYMFSNFGHHNSDLSPFSVIAAEYMFGDNPEDTAEREAYLRKMRENYKESAFIAFATINGGARDFLSSAEYDRAVSMFIKHGGLKRKDAEALLENGIPGLRVNMLPQAGFFLLVDYEDMFEFALAEEMFNFDLANKFIRDRAHNDHKLGLGSPDYTLLPKETHVFRMTVAHDPEDLVACLLRLNEWAQDIKQNQPFLTNDGTLVCQADKKPEEEVVAPPDRPQPSNAGIMEWVSANVATGRGVRLVASSLRSNEP